MIRHSTVSLDYLEMMLRKGKSAGIGEPQVGHWPMPSQRWQVKQWRDQGYTFAPPCDHVTPDGRCAGHEREEQAHATIPC